MPNKQLAKNLQALRMHHGYTQKHIGNYLNITHQAYSNYEQGQRTPDVGTLMKIARLYEVTLDQLVSTNIRPDAGILAIPNESLAPYRLTLAENKDTKNTLYVTEDELDLILSYRELSPEDAKIALSFIKAQAGAKK